MKKLIVGLFAVFAFIACDKNDDNNSNNTHGVNKLRVVKISGSNDMWGENYTLKITYNSRNQIDKAYAMNNAGDTLTYIEGRKDNNDMIYTVNDYERDAETGKLIKDTQKRYEVTNKMSGLVVVSQIIELFAPKTVISPDDYEPEKYIKVSYTKYIYEYDEAGKLINSRKMLKSYNTDPEDAYYYNDEFETSVSKDRVVYQGNKVVKIENYVSDSGIDGENYRLFGNEVFNYSGDLLQSIETDNNGGKKIFSYSGNDIVVNGVTYTLNNDGFVTKIKHSDGSIVTIEYEAGAGNFETLSPIFNTLYSIPTIQ